MIFVPNISPIAFEQLKTGKNLSLDMGNKFFGVDYPCIARFWDVDVPIILIFYSSTIDPTLTVNGNSLGYIDITPTNWAGTLNYVFQTIYAPQAENETIDFKITDSESEWNSEQVTAIDDTSELIKIQYRNTENDFGYVGDSILTTYVSAEYLNPIGADELFSYIDDRGEVVKQTATINEAYEVTVIKAEYTLVNMLRKISGCDYIRINSQPFQINESIDSSRVQTSSISTVTFVIIRTEDNYMFYGKPDLTEPPFLSDVLFWFIKDGTVWTDNGPKWTGYTRIETNGTLDFQIAGIAQLVIDSEIFNRGNVTIQNDDARVQPDYNPTFPFLYTFDELSEGEGDGVSRLVDWLNDGYAGKVYVKDGLEQILVYETDKTFLEDKTCMEFMVQDNFVGDPLDSQNILEFGKYNIIKNN